jgi:hypothetical protein
VESNELNLEELYNIYTDPQQIKDSFEKRTLPTGTYTFYASRGEARSIPADASWCPGRKTASFFGQLKNAEGKRVGSVGFDASWEPVYYDDKHGHRRQDGMGMRWGQLVVALDMAAKPVPEIIDAAKRYPFNVYVTEAFRNPETQQWETAFSDDPSAPPERQARQRKAYRAKGWESRNFVQTIKRVS